VFYDTAQLDPTIDVSGSTVDGALVVSLTGFQRATNVGSLRWSIQNPPAGVTIDANSGALTVADGVGVTSSGVATVTAVGGSGVISNPAALSFSVTTSVLPAPSRSSLDWVVSDLIKTFSLASRLYTPMATPIQWSITSPVPSDISLTSSSEILSIQAQSTWKGSFTVVATDRLGRSSSPITINVRFMKVIMHVLSKNGYLKDTALNHTVGMVGNVIVKSDNSARSGASGFFDGASYLTSPWASDLRLTGDFTIQGWAYPTSTNVVNPILSYGTYDKGFIIRRDWLAVKGENLFGLTAHFPLNTWVFFTLNRKGSVIRFYTNGTLVFTYNEKNLGTIFADSTAMNIAIGASVHNIQNERFSGNLEDIRIVEGWALDGTMVPTAPLSSTI
jgi:hypothetical protein